MTKERRTVSLDPNVNEYLNNPGVNASELVNNLIENYYKGNGEHVGMLQLRRDQITSSINDLENQLENKEHELELINEKLNAHKETREDTIDEFREEFPRDMWNPENPAVENWARKHDMTVNAFLEAVMDRD